MSDPVLPRPWLPLRFTQIGLVAAVALFATLVAFGNLTDYGTNFAFVQHVLRMDTIFPDATVGYRAIESAWVQHLAYALIIATEVLVALLCWAGAIRLWARRHEPPVLFRQAKGLAIVGLTLGCLLWFTGFITIGGEWFAMWMSSQWNGIASAFRFFVLFGFVLLYLVVRDD